MSLLLAGPLAVLLLCQTGCTSRGMTITSLPEGAEVSVNRRVVGKTPIRMNYTHYGSYRIELRKDKYETLVQTEKIRPPWYGFDPLSFIADNVVPIRLNDEVSMHYVMKPIEEGLDRDSLMDRALAARGGQIKHPTTGEMIAVDMAPSKTAGIETIEPGTETTAQRAPGPEPKADLNLPAEPETVAEQPAQPAARTIDETRPEGPRIAREMGLEPEKKPEEAKPAETPKPDPAAQPKRMRRTPTGEILIYEEEPIEDPEKKK